MASTRLYTAIYVVLFVLATVQVLIEDVAGEAYWTALTAILVLSFVKAVIVAGYYQHLKYEPRSLTYLIVTGLLAALALTMAAAYSIT